MRKDEDVELNRWTLDLDFPFAQTTSKGIMTAMGKQNSKVFKKKHFSMGCQKEEKEEMLLPLEV